MALDIDISPLKDVEALAAQWRDLEAAAPPNIFLSWTWIGCWLETSQKMPFVLRARAGETLIALALLIPRQTRRHAIVMPRQLWLHETGDIDLDRITIEYNGFLVRADAPETTVTEIFAYLLAQRTNIGWDEIVLGGIDQALLDMARRTSLHVSLKRHDRTYAVPLSQYQDSEKTWLGSLSRNTRAKVQQATRFAERIGPLVIEAADSVAQSLTFFAALQELHQERWKHMAEGGAFSTKPVRAFHERLIACGVQNGSVELLRIRAGETVLGYLYNLIAGRTVYNYQSGFRRQDDNRHRPGLVAHRLCIERAQEKGFEIYDLMAGDMRFKQNIARPSGDLYWVRVQAPHLGLRLERLARKAKQHLAFR